MDENKDTESKDGGTGGGGDSSDGDEEDESLNQTLPLHVNVWSENNVITVTTLAITWSNCPIMTNEGITREI